MIKNYVKARATDPLTTENEIKRLRYGLSKSKLYADRNLLIFSIGINTGFRISDIVKLKVRDVQGDNIDVLEQKTHKRRLVKINRKLREEIDNYIATYNLNSVNYLFESQKSMYLTARAYHKIIKKAARDAALKGNIGTHTMRKTFAYFVMKSSNNKEKTLKTLQHMMNHSNINITERYITSSVDFEEIYEKLNL